MCTTLLSGYPLNVKGKKWSLQNFSGGAQLIGTTIKHKYTTRVEHALIQLFNQAAFLR